MYNPIRHFYGKFTLYAALPGLTSTTCGQPLDAHRRALVLLTSGSAAGRAAALLRVGELGEAVALLEADLGRIDPPPEPLPTLLRRSVAMLRLEREGFALPAPKHCPTGEQNDLALFVLHSRGPLVANGYAARSEELVRAWSRAGGRARIVTRLGYPHDINRYRDESLPEAEEWAGAECRRLSDPGDGMRGRPLDDYLAAYASALAAAMAGSRPAVVHAASNYVNGLAAATACREAGIPFVYDVRGLWEVTALSRGDFGEEDLRFRLARRLETEAAQAADMVIALSEGLKNKLCARGVPPERIVVLPNTTDVEGTPPVRADPAARQAAGIEAPFVVGYFGSLAAYEGLELLLQAIARLKATGERIAAVIAGAGPAEPALRKQAETSGIQDLILMTGAVPRGEVARYAALADAVVLPRLDLPITRIVPPIKAVEAMARSQPLIVSSVPALTELIEPDVEGIVFPSGDVDALASALSRLARDPARCRTMGQAARRRALTHYDRAHMAASLRDVYELAKANHGRAAADSVR